MRLIDQCLCVCLAATVLAASEHRGQVVFRGLGVPGAIVVALQGEKESTAITDPQGVYRFADLAAGIWSLEVTMFGFAQMKQQVVVAGDAPVARWELTMLALDQIRATARPAAAAVRVASEPPAEDLSERAADGLLINGSVNNAEASPFAQAAAFGNSRTRGRKLYTGGIGVTLGNSAFDARPFSLTGQSTPRAPYSRTTGMVSLGGPLQIPHLLKNGPNFFVGYQWTRNNNATIASALVPTAEQRNGAVPPSLMRPQALALLSFYPMPNVDAGAGYNYQAQILNPTHQDALQSRLMKSLSGSNQVFGHFNLQSTRMDNTNLFGFLDTTAILGINTSANWSHRFNSRLFLNAGIQFSRLTTRVNPYFADRANVSEQAGILGNSQDARDWGPPTLHFSSGIASLSDAQSAFNRNQTSGLSASMQWNRRAHNIAFGGDFRRQAFNYLNQQDPRGTFTFTGAETGSDFADFLLGIPAASSIAFGNADKYFRQSVYDAFISDDWRVTPGITLNIGLRWEYGAPITELYGRLVNLDIAPGFTGAAPVVGGDPVHPFKHGYSPRIGLAWRPLGGSSMVVRAGYGVYYDTSVYQAIASRMAQQPPLSKTFSIQNIAANPLTLANGFGDTSSNNTFAIDPSFRPGYAQNWQLSVQQNLPAALQLTATYLGIKGTHAMQAFLPNTFPVGTANPCASCPTGFAYVVSNGNSSRHSAQMQLRRRLRSGFGAALQYTFSKSIDNAAALGWQGGSPTGLGGLAIAQNWLDLNAERGLSAFDQRHVLSMQAQYTTGIRLGGGALFGGWTLATQITAGSGLPQTPIYLAPVQDTGVTGTIRPDYTGAPQYAGRFLNLEAYAAPLPGRWGNAGRNSITGPSQFLLNASLGRTFQLNDRFNLDLRVDSSNALNRVNFTAWNATVNSPQFGLPAAANAMRNVQTTLRLRF